MEIFNIGPLELGLILILALIVLGPNGMAKTSRQVARWIAKFVRSPIWKDLISTSEEIRSIPKNFVKEANLEESIKEINDLSRKPFVDLNTTLKEIEKPIAVEPKPEEPRNDSET